MTKLHFDAPLPEFAGRKIFIAAGGSVYQDPPSCQALVSLLQKGASAYVFHGDQSGFVGERPAGQVREYQVSFSGNVTRRLRGFLYMLRYRAALNRCLREYRPDVFISMTHLPLAVGSNAALRHCKVRVGAVLDIMPRVGNGRLEDFVHRSFWRRIVNCTLTWASDPGKAEETRRRIGSETSTFVCFNSPVLAFPNEVEKSNIDELAAACRMNKDTLLRSSAIMVRAGAVGGDSELEATIAGMRYAPKDAILIALGQPTTEYRDGLLNLAHAHGLEKRIAIIRRPTVSVWRQALSVAKIGHMLLTIPTEGYAREKWRLNGPLSHNRLFQYLALGLPIFASEDVRLRDFAGDSPWLQILGGETHAPEQIGRQWALVSGSAELLRVASEDARRKFIDSYHWEKQFAPVLSEISNQLIQQRD